MDTQSTLVFLCLWNSGTDCEHEKIHWPTPGVYNVIEEPLVS